MVKKRKFVVVLLLPLLVLCFLSVGYAQLADTSIISMGGSDWSLKVDSALASSIDSRNTPYMTAKSTTEKELFLELATLEDCKSGVVQFKVDMVGLTAYKQLPLAQKEIDEGSFRPQNVVNSYACFDSSGRKVLHIYASKIVDAKGVEVWLDQDLTEGLLTVILPKPEVLETLTFPLLLDPTFGYTSIGASTSNQGNTFIATKFNLTEAASLVSMHVYSTNVERSCQMAVYNDSSGIAAKLYNTSVVSLPDGAAWVYGNLTGSLSAGEYWLACLFISGTGNAVVYYDSGDVGQTVYKTSYGDTLLDPAGTMTGPLDWVISLYATYTAEAEPTPTPSPTPVGSVSPTPFPEGAMDDTDWWISILLLAVVVINVVLIAVPFALLRFVFACMAFLLAALCLSYQIPLSPYMQSLGMVVSVVCMFLAARARE